MSKIVRLIGKTIGLEPKQLAAKKYQLWAL